jgi:predicted RNA-binding protein YlxR (DUF448 family)
MQQRKVPLRQCGGCGEQKPKGELVRIVRSPEGEIFFDPTGKKNGRGSYICNNKKCFEKAVKAKRFERAFEAKIPDQVVKQILEEIDGE